MTDSERSQKTAPTDSEPTRPAVRRSTLKLLAEDPFRLMFPAGIIAGIIGVLLWPLLYAGCLDFYPKFAHARLMVAGFLGAFAIGFLGTAFPRMVGAPCLRIWELGTLFAIYVSAAVCQTIGQLLAGDILFLILMSGFFFSMAWRWIVSRDEHPPFEFLVALGGVVCAIAGFGIQAASSYISLDLHRYRFSSLLIYQGLTALPILAVGGFFAPRMLKKPAEEPARSNGMATAIAAFLFVITLAIEAWGAARMADLARFCIFLGYFAFWTDVFKKTQTPGSLALALRISVWSLLLSFLSGTIWPHLRIGVEHIAFISGFGLLALTVASRVILGHSGNGSLFFARNRPMKWIIWIVVIGMLTRVSADFVPEIMMSHHIYAAILWAIATIIWLWWLFPKLQKSDEE